MKWWRSYDEVPWSLWAFAAFDGDGEDGSDDTTGAGTTGDVDMTAGFTAADTTAGLSSDPFGGGNSTGSDADAGKSAADSGEDTDDGSASDAVGAVGEVGEGLSTDTSGYTGTDASAAAPDDGGATRGGMGDDATGDDADDADDVGSAASTAAGDVGGATAAAADDSLGGLSPNGLSTDGLSAAFGAADATDALGEDAFGAGATAAQADAAAEDEGDEGVGAVGFSAAFGASDAAKGLSDDPFSDTEVTEGITARDSISSAAGLDTVGLSVASLASDSTKGVTESSFDNPDVMEGHALTAIGGDLDTESVGSLAGAIMGFDDLIGTTRSPAAREAEERSVAELDAYRGFFDDVISVEAQKAPNPVTGAYDPFNGLVDKQKGWRGVAPPTHAPLTDMTLSEVRGYQRGMIARGHASTAVGAFQMTAAMLDETIASFNKHHPDLAIDPDKTKFSKAVQEMLAMERIENFRAPMAMVNGLIDKAKLHDQLANEWAGLKGTNNRGKYDDDGVNKGKLDASVVADHVDALVDSGAVGAVDYAGHPAPPDKPGFTSTTEVGETETAWGQGAVMDAVSRGFTTPEEGHYTSGYEAAMNLSPHADDMRDASLSADVTDVEATASPDRGSFSTDTYGMGSPDESHGNLVGSGLGVASSPAVTEATSPAAQSVEATTSTAQSVEPTAPSELTDPIGGYAPASSAVANAETGVTSSVSATMEAVGGLNLGTASYGSTSEDDGITAVGKAVADAVEGVAELSDVAGQNAAAAQSPSVAEAQSPAVSAIDSVGAQPAEAATTAAEVDQPAVTTPNVAETEEAEEQEEFARVYLGKPAEVEDSEEAVPAEEAEAEEAQAAPKDSLGEKIAAAAIDAAIAAIPGIGTAVSIANLGLGVSGQKTIGGMIADSMFDGEARTDVDSDWSDHGNDGNAYAEELREKAGKPDDDDYNDSYDFAITYLGWEDKKERPTPEEKWGTPSTYGRREYAA